MDRLRKVFIVREYLYPDDANWINIYNEAVFLSLADAKEYSKSLYDFDISNYYFTISRIGIVEYTIGDNETQWREMIYNYKGELIDEHFRGNAIQNLDGFDLDCLKPTGKFRMGDIVYIVPRIENKFSPSIEGTYGVIANAPLLGERWINFLKKKDGFHLTDCYKVYYISKYGNINHWHILEYSLKPTPDKIPTELNFLEIFSEHLKGNISLSEETLEALASGALFVKKMKRFDFIKMKIVAY